MKILILLLIIPYNSQASVEDLFRKSLSSSKQVKIISLEEQRSLSSLKTDVTTLYPQVDIFSDNKYRNNTYQAKSGLGKVDSSLGLSLSQKIFQGGSEFSIINLKKIVPKQAKALKNSQLANYYAQFCTYYFQLSSAHEENEKINLLLENLNKRLVLVKRRTRIGRDRKADLYALESQYERLKADFFTTQAKLGQARNNFLNYSGLEKIEISKERLDPLSLEFNTNVNLRNRPELEKLQFDYEAAEESVKIEKANYMPQASLGANYSIENSYTGKDDWDVSLNFTMNLLDFGKNSSRVQTKKIESRIAKTRYDLNLENSNREWQNFINLFSQKKEEYRLLKRSLEKIKLSYRRQVKDLDKGLIGQIDVIRSLDDVIGLEKLVINSALDLKSLYYQAKAYLGDFSR